MKKVFLVFIAIFMIFIVSCNDNKSKEYTVTLLEDGNTPSIISFTEETIGDIQLTECIKEGYRFLGWYENEILITKINELRNYSLHAVFEKTCNITLINTLNDSKEIFKLNKTEFNSFSLPELEIDGYRFLGWYDNDSLITNLSFKDYTLNAVFEKTCTITLINTLNDTEETYHLTEEEFSNFILPELSIEGYHFYGWYLDDNKFTYEMEFADYTLKSKFKVIDIVNMDFIEVEKSKLNNPNDYIPVYFDMLYLGIEQNEKQQNFSVILKNFMVPDDSTYSLIYPKYFENEEFDFYSFFTPIINGPKNEIKFVDGMEITNVKVDLTSLGNNALPAYKDLYTEYDLSLINNGLRIKPITIKLSFAKDKYVFNQETLEPLKLEEFTRQTLLIEQKNLFKSIEEKLDKITYSNDISLFDRLCSYNSTIKIIIECNAFVEYEEKTYNKEYSFILFVKCSSTIDDFTIEWTL